MKVNNKNKILNIVIIVFITFGYIGCGYKTSPIYYENEKSSK